MAVARQLVPMPLLLGLLLGPAAELPWGCQKVLLQALTWIHVQPGCEEATLVPPASPSSASAAATVNSTSSGPSPQQV